MHNMSALERNADLVFTDIACTLQARDYKGLNNYGFKGVIECKEVRADIK